MTQNRPLNPVYPALNRSYPSDFTVDDQYRATLPDLQNGPASLIVGARRLIQHVGISNFRLPVRFRTRATHGRRCQAKRSVPISRPNE